MEAREAEGAGGGGELFLQTPEARAMWGQQVGLGTSRGCGWGVCCGLTLSPTLLPSRPPGEAASWFRKIP